ncbi:MAG: ABC transporter ATP-binding protein [Clostridium sp.]|uniref:ABC transporter ATP-binding protein n=1 Tax=Clostridium sp. TaxID=1506 RepID=UPI003D6D9566
MMELMDIHSGYNGLEKIGNINIKIKKGCITSIIGPNGSGKTTLLKVASGLIPPYSGEILLNNIPINSIGKKEFAKKVSILPQIRNATNIIVSSLVMHGRFPYLGFSRKLSIYDREKVEYAMELTGVTKFRGKNLLELSGGERQKVYIAMIVAQDTDVIFFDEPITYLDINQQFQVMELIKNLNKMGKTIVIVLHDIVQALIHSHRICVMNRGEIKSYGTPEEILKKKVINEVFGVVCKRIDIQESSHSYYLSQI